MQFLSSSRARAGLVALSNGIEIQARWVSGLTGGRPAGHAVQAPQDHAKSAARQRPGRPHRSGCPRPRGETAASLSRRTDGCVGARAGECLAREHRTLARTEKTQTVRFPRARSRRGAGLCGLRGLHRIQGVPTDALLQVRRGERARHDALRSRPARGSPAAAPFPAGQTSRPGPVTERHARRQREAVHQGPEEVATMDRLVRDPDHRDFDRPNRCRVEASARPCRRGSGTSGRAHRQYCRPAGRRAA